MNNVCIIGGGASGIMAALFAQKAGARVTLFEKNSELGKKLLRTGNGKCNFSNLNMNHHYFNSDDSMFVKDALAKFNEKELIFYLTQLGLLIKDKNGYLYPYSEQASSVRDLLVSEINSLFINVRLNTNVNCIERTEDGHFLISLEGQKEREIFDRVIISTGGFAGLTKKERTCGYSLLKKLGVSSSPIYPGLTKLICSGLDFEALKGNRCECKLSLFIEDEPLREDYGELMFWEKGISGICVFSLSRFCKKALTEGKEVVMKLDLLPLFYEDNLKDYILPRFLVNQDKSIGEFLRGMLPKAINSDILKINGIDENTLLNDLDISDVLNIVINMKKVYVKVTDVADFDQAQVTVGGVNLSEINDRFEVKNIPGLFVTGETLNVDGPCGGYNLQWAFTSGAIAGENVCY